MSGKEAAPKLNVAEGFWNTCVYAGVTTTFRVLSPQTSAPVDAVSFLTTLTTRIHRLDASLKEIVSDASGPDANAAEHDEEVRTAAECVYKSLEVEVSLLDDPAAVPADPSCDAAVDLWLPMHLAVMVQDEVAIGALLSFHQNHALSVLQHLAGSALGVEEYAPGSGALAAAGANLNATRSSLASTATTVTTTTAAAGGGGGSAATGADDDALASGEQTPSNKTYSVHELTATRSSASPEDARLNASEGGSGGPGSRGTAPVMRQRPVVELQVRPEMGQALVLLGHYVTTPATAAVTAAPSVASTRTTKPTASPMRRRSSLGGTSSQAPYAGSDRSDVHAHVDPTSEPNSATDDEAAAAWLNLNLRQMQIEAALFEDAGESLCVGNVLGMLKSLIRVAVAAEVPSDGAAAAAARQRVSDLIDPEVLGHLYVSHTVVYEACGGDLNRLEAVLTAFQGALAPVMRGKSLPYSVSGKSVVQQRSSMVAAAVARSGGLVDTPTMRPISRTSSGMLADATGTPRGRASLNATVVAGSVAPPSLPAGVHSASTPFWVNCAPQEAQQLAFCGMWIAFREQYTEGNGSARVHRHVGIRQDYRLAIAGLKKARLPNFGQYRSSTAVGGHSAHATAFATVVPTSSSIVSSGQLFLISRLISPECRVEEFLDLTEDASLFNSLAPTSFTANSAGGATSANGGAGSFCGVLPLVLAASAFAASELRSPSQIRLLVNKMDTMISDSRNTSLRSYVCGRPATHSDRFEELWLSESANSAPKKFKTRAEMLFYSTLEQVLLGAERSWAEETILFAENSQAPSQTAGRTPEEKAEADKRFRDRLASMAKALQSWIALWRNFLINVRDRPVGPGAVHRRSVSSVSRTSATATPKMQPMAAASVPPPPLDVSGAAAASATAFAPDPVAAVAAAVAAGVSPAGAPEEDEATEAVEVVQKLLDALPLRLQHGEPPLPEIGTQLFPPSAAPTEDPSTVTEMPQTTLDSEFEYSQHSFGDMAGSESNDIKLKFYGLFKQATVGDINISKPWLMDQVGRAKWEAWNKLKGMNVTDAKRMYVSEFKMLKHMRSTAAAGAHKK